MTRTLDEIRVGMRRLTEPSGDTEADHADADGLLVETILWVCGSPGAAGWAPWLREIVEDYDRVKKWYA